MIVPCLWCEETFETDEIPNGPVIVNGRAHLLQNARSIAAVERWHRLHPAPSEPEILGSAAQSPVDAFVSIADVEQPV